MGTVEGIDENLEAFRVVAVTIHLDFIGSVAQQVILHLANSFLDGAFRLVVEVCL